MSEVEEILPESCRICLKCCKQSRCLLIRSNHNKGIISMLSSLMKVELILDHEWPSNLCKICEEELIISYNFLEKCHTANLKIGLCKSKVDATNVKIESDATSTISDISDGVRNKLAKNQEASTEDVISKTEFTNECEDSSHEVLDNDDDDDYEEEKEVLHYEEHQRPVETVKMEMKITECESISDINEGNKQKNKSVADRKKTLPIHTREKVKKKHTEKSKEKSEPEEGGFCERCNRNTGNLKKHNYIFHESATARIFEECKKGDNPTCKVCGKKFKSNITLRGHIKLVHTDDLPYKCRFCNRPTQSSTALIAHERLHTGEKAFICHFCGKGYPNKINLQSHLVQHTGKKHFCEICGKAFSRNSFLQLHMKRHTGDFRYLCTQCGKKFIVTASYKEHLRTHTNERPFKCDICEKAFKKRSTWRRHLGIHTGYKPLQCKHCPYSCAVPYRMRQHMKTHDKEEPASESNDNLSAEMPSQ